jgi:hypothetical protein
MRETCARVLAAALMTGAIAIAMGLPTLFESDGNPGRLTAPPSSLQRSVRSPLLTPGAHPEQAPQRSTAPAQEGTTRDRAASSRVAQAVTRSNPRPAGAGKSPAPKPATPKPQPAPEPAPATEPETRELASSPAPPAPAPPTPGAEHGKKKSKSKESGKAKSKAKPAEHAGPAEATPPPPAADCEDPAPDADQPTAEDAKHGNGKGGDEPKHDKKGKG